jgi:hypothetical protein
MILLKALAWKSYVLPVETIKWLLEFITTSLNKNAELTSAVWQSARGTHP